MQHPEAERLYLKIIHVLHPRYHSKIVGDILKIKQMSKCVCIHDITRLTIMKMKIKMKYKSYRYDNRSRRGHKNNKYKVLQYNDAYMY